MDMKEAAKLSIQTWEDNLRIQLPNFKFTEAEKTYMEIAFEAGYKVAKKEMGV